MLSYFIRRQPTEPVQASDRYHEGAWAYVAAPTQSELDELVGMLGVQADLLQDALDPNEVPRLQQENGVTYFFVRVPYGQGEGIQTVPLLLALGSSFFLTLSAQRLVFLDKFPAGELAFTTTSPSQLFLQICIHITAVYQHALTDISRRVRAGLVSGGSVANEDIVRLVAYEGIINDLLGGFGPMHAMLTSIGPSKTINLPDEDKDLYEDAVLGAGQVVEALKAQLRTTVNFREAYSLLTANELNKFVKLFTSLSLIMTIPNLVVNFWSMNIALPLQHNPHMFIFMVITTLAMIGALAYFFSRKKLL